MTKQKFSLKRLRQKSNWRAVIWNSTRSYEPSDNEELLFRAVELGGEAGEVLNKVKKYIRFKQDIPGGLNEEEFLQAVKEELADTIICVDRIASLLDIDLDKAVIEKFNLTSDKHGFGVKL